MASDMVQVRRSGGADYSAPTLRISRSQFRRDHQHKTTFDAGRLVPYFVDEVLPGDTITLKLNSFCRIFSPLDAPIMDNIEVSIDFFYVPNRLVWDRWEDFLGAHTSAGAQDTEYTIPIISQASSSVVAGQSIADYMGVPQTLDFQDVEVSALPFRAYRLIYNEWYRDQNLLNELTVSTGEGPDSAGNANSSPMNSAKRHDYFTSALPYLQKGPEQVIPFDDAPIVGIGALDTVPSLTPGTIYETSGNTTYPDGAYTGSEIALRATAPSAARAAVYADLSSVAVSINALRESVAIQRMLERDARGGTRLPELIRAHFGVTVPDYRVQRPEYLGGGSGYINVNPVANTSATAEDAQGKLTGYGAGTLTCSWAKSFVEHGYVIGLLRARGELSYQQGLDRMFSRSTKYDFFWPELANLGEQEVLNKEIYVSNTSADDDVFGYQERYAEYRFKKSLITGKLNSEAPGSLDWWHLAEDFASTPSLNQTFIEDQTPMERVVAVTDEPDFIIDGFFEYRCARPIPVRPTPSLMPARF